MKMSISLGGGLCPPSETSPQDEWRRRSRRSKCEILPAACSSLAPPRRLRHVSVSQVRATDRVVLLEVGGRTVQHHAAGLEQVDVVGEVEGEGGVLLDEEHAHTLVLVDGPHDAEDLADHERGEAER